MEMNTWDRRDPKLEDDRRYQHILEIHHLTQIWLNEIAPEAKVSAGSPRLHRLERFIPPNLVQNLWLLEKLKLDKLLPDLSTMVDATSVSEFLDELEEMIWIVQLSVLNNALEHTTDAASLINSLEQITWQEGKIQAEAKWNINQTRAELSISDIAKTLADSAIQKKDAFLFEQQNSHHCSFYWLTSPLSISSLNHHPSVLTLCQLYHQYMRGFFYGIEKSIKVDVTPSTLGQKRVWRITLLSTY